MSKTKKALMEYNTTNERILQENPQAYKLTAKSVQLGIPLQILEGYVSVAKKDANAGTVRLPLGIGDRFIVLANRDELSYYVYVFDALGENHFGWCDKKAFEVGHNFFDTIVVEVK